MKNKFFVWGSGKRSETVGDSSYDGNIKTIPEFTSSPIEEVYVKDNCTLYLAGGELYKEGNFNFEMINNNIESQKTHRKLVNFNWKNKKETVTDVSIGESHVLVLTKQGNVYSWGDNYYGQLGVDRNMLPWVSEPEPVKISNVKSIYAYKNNSFAIDAQNKLWVWGKKDYLGGKIFFHQFKPINILKNFAIEKVKILNDCLIVSGKVPEKEIEKEMKKEENAENIQNEKILNNKMEKNPDLNLDQIIGFVKETGENLKNFVAKLSEEDIKLVDIRKKILNGPGLNNLEDHIKEMAKVFLKTINRDSRKLSKEKLSFNETSDLIFMVLKSLIIGKFQNNQIDSINKNLSVQEKQINNLISQFDVLSSNNLFAIFNKNLQTLTNHFLKYKKIEYLIYKMSFHQNMLKNFQFGNVLNALKFIFEDEENVEKKLYLLEKSFDVLNLLLEKTNAGFKDISLIYNKLNKFNMIDDNTTESDKFIYKYIIESGFYIRDLWKLLMENVKEHRKAKEKETAMQKVLQNYKELHSIQMYLNSISLTTIGIKKKVDSLATDDPDSKEDNHNGIEEIIKQTEGAIKRLEFLINKYMDLNYDHFSKELIIFYAAAILDSAHNRKMLYSLFASIQGKIPQQIIK